MIVNDSHIKPAAKYELREAAMLLGVSKSTIQRWTKEGILKCQVRTVNNRRIWTGAELISAFRRTR